MPWSQASSLQSQSFVCGYCGHKVGAHLGFSEQRGHNVGAIYICPHCDKPTYFELAQGRRTPGALIGNSVEQVPKEVGALYEEARKCCSTSAYTAAVLLCRKLLMNVAVSVGAAPNQSFMSYVEHLAKNGYVPPNGKGWVDHIRKKGNEATHEILVMTENDAKDLIGFSEMLLKFIYEFPSRVPASP
jgi:hypothetical protein